MPRNNGSRAVTETLLHEARVLYTKRATLPREAHALKNGLYLANPYFRLANNAHRVDFCTAWIAESA